MASIPTTPTYRKNPENLQQSKIEGVAFSEGVPVFEDAKTRVIPNGAEGASERTAHGTRVGSVGNNAGVVMPISDVPNRFLSDYQGKR